MRKLLFLMLFLCSFLPVYADEAYISWTEDIEYILSLDSLAGASSWIQQSYSGYECRRSGEVNQAGMLSCKQEYPVKSIYECSITFSMSGDGPAAGMSGSCKTKEEVEMKTLEEDYKKLTDTIELSCENYVSPNGLYVSEDEWKDIVHGLFKTYKSQIKFSYWLYGKNVVVSRLFKEKINNKTENSISVDVFDARYML